MKIVECKQLSPEWWNARRGVPTASEFHRIITPKTGKLAAAHEDYIHELVAQVYAPVWPPEDRYQSPAMRNGAEREAEARAWYAMERFVDIWEVGFCTTDDGRFGCSPDGLTPAGAGGLEIKCPDLKTHVRYKLAGTLPDEHKAQVHGCLCIAGASWWDFVSYAPPLDPLVICVAPDDYTAKMAAVLDEFWDRYQEVLNHFKGG